MISKNDDILIDYIIKETKENRMNWEIERNYNEVMYTSFNHKLSIKIAIIRNFLEHSFMYIDRIEKQSQISRKFISVNNNSLYVTNLKILSLISIIYEFLDKKKFEEFTKSELERQKALSEIIGNL